MVYIYRRTPPGTAKHPTDRLISSLQEQTQKPEQGRLAREFINERENDGGGELYREDAARRGGEEGRRWAQVGDGDDGSARRVRRRQRRRQLRGRRGRRPGGEGARRLGETARPPVRQDVPDASPPPGRPRQPPGPQHASPCGRGRRHQHHILRRGLHTRHGPLRPGARRCHAVRVRRLTSHVVLLVRVHLLFILLPRQAQPLSAGSCDDHGVAREPGHARGPVPVLPHLRARRRGRPAVPAVPGQGAAVRQEDRRRRQREEAQDRPERRRRRDRLKGQILKTELDFFLLGKTLSSQFIS